MAPQTQADRAAAKRKERDAKQKKLLLALVPVLVIVVVIMGPKLLKQLKGSEDAAPAPAAAAPAATSGGATSPAGTPVPTDPAAIAAATKSLPNSDQAPAADEDQLISFSRFDPKDPFQQLVVDQADVAPSDSGSTPTPAPSTPSTPTAPTVSGGGTYTTPPPPVTSPTSVTIKVNGQVLVLVVGDTFPPADPAFRIVAINSDSVMIGLADGSFNDGNQSITVQKGSPVTLVSQPDGARFTIEFVSAS